MGEAKTKTVQARRRRGEGVNEEGHFIMLERELEG